ncbi:MAG: hypothetical protein US30_C0007G0003 [Candidatus Moranbacteria bacterium GW2011_GWF2_36_839]|nr:MAG: hypothetical protein US27_C0007G0047 [Candidatus Moranbacteria bacterium GW2011_GWF1_36_78]KKQ17057.1 MAG: hypothetical protein US30_C0007G0003 [Candidatus Moranbacteria bacterium GW2011_GWF2_36_839]HAT73659.1 hypothetical protein [Candidatus Moranbacteria bacterium]HBY11364.1 hypothetical protein [Candidatus Moranbacteria bacterium]
MKINLGEKDFKTAVILSGIMIVLLCWYRMTTIAPNTVGHMQGSVGWMDSCYLHNGCIDQNVLLSQWPFGHDVRVYDTGGILKITQYRRPLIYECKF